jgi:hypothetical protein
MRTSISHPLQIAVVTAGSEVGRIGITFCPGKYDPHAMTRGWLRDLNRDFDAIRDWGAAAVVTLLEPEELTLLKVERLGEEVLRRNTAPKPSSTVDSPAPALVTRHLDRDEVASLINRGEGLIKSGDLSSARLALRRAAEAGDVHAALLLAGTFDPNLLEKLGFQEQGIDVAMARFWYERAAQLGSAEAPGRLQQLATKMPLH